MQKTHLKMKEITPNNTKKPTLPAFDANLWGRIFHHTTLADGASFAQAAHGARDRWQRYLSNTQEGCRRILTEKGILSEEVLLHAERQGVSLDCVLLYHLYQIDPLIIRHLYALRDTQAWALAAICGDLKWFIDNMPKADFPMLVTRFGMTAIELLAFGGHIDRLAILFKSNYYGKNFLVNSIKNLIRYAARAGNENSLEKLFAIKKDKLNEPQETLDNLMFGGHLQLALTHFKRRMVATRNNKEKLEEWSLGAAERGHFHICDFLEKKFRVSQCIANHKQETILHFAAFFDDAPRVKKLLTHYPEMPKDAQQRFPISFAAQGGAKNTYLLLIPHHQAPRNIKVIDDANPLVCAIEGRQRQMFSLLVEDFGLPATNDSGVNLLSISALYCDWSFFLFLRDTKKIPATWGRLNISPLMVALRNAKFLFAKHYIEEYGEGAVHEKDLDGDNALSYVLMSRNLAVLRDYIDTYSLNINSENNQEQNALTNIAEFLTGLTDTSQNAANYGRLWPFLKVVIKEYQSQLTPGWHERADKKGQSFMDYVRTADQEAEFNFLNTASYGMK